VTTCKAFTSHDTTDDDIPLTLQVSTEHMTFETDLTVAEADDLRQQLTRALGMPRTDDPKIVLVDWLYARIAQLEQK
jgi:hypothetical protein